MLYITEDGSPEFHTYEILKKKCEKANSISFSKFMQGNTFTTIEMRSHFVFGSSLKIVFSHSCINTKIENIEET